VTGNRSPRTSVELVHFETATCDQCGQKYEERVALEETVRDLMFPGAMPFKIRKICWPCAGRAVMIGLAIMGKNSRL